MEHNLDTLENKFSQMQEGQCFRDEKASSTEEPWVIAISQIIFNKLILLLVRKKCI